MTSTLRVGIYRLWAPLALTWIMMSAEGPLLTAFVARMPESKLNLAAYGLALSLLLLCEAPILGMLSASIAIVEDGYSLKRLAIFSHVNSALLSGLVFALSLDVVFGATVEKLMLLEPELSALVKRALFLCAPIPFGVSYRRLYQGVLVRAGHGKTVAAGTVGRFGALSAAGAWLFIDGQMSGVEVGAAALTIGIVVEATLVRRMSRGEVGRLAGIELERHSHDLTFLGIARFYYPFALSMIITLSISPIVSFFLAHSLLSLESLALFPVITAVTMMFRSGPFAYQEVAVAILATQPTEKETVRRVALEIGVGSSAALALLFLTPLRDWWFTAVGGLSEDLVALSSVPAYILTASPILAALICYHRGYFISRRKTPVITVSGLIELVSIAAAMYAGVFLLGGIGIVVASLALVIGALLSAIYLSISEGVAEGR